MPIKKNDVIKLEITSVDSNGQGIGKYEGMVIFIPMTITGDVVNAKILKIKKNYAFAKLESIVEKSKHRVNSDCEIFSKCGGCALRHIEYSEELKIKEEKVKSAIQRIALLNSEIVNNIVGAKEYNYYRNKAQIPVGVDKDGNIQIGFFTNHSHRIIDSRSCLLQPKIFSDVIDIFKQWLINYNIPIYNEVVHRGIVRHLYIRLAEKTNELMVCVVINSHELPYKDELVKMLKNGIYNLKTVIVNFNTDKTNVIVGNKCKTIFGAGYIIDELCGLKFKISPLSFYQVNRDQAEVVYNIAKRYAKLEEKDVLLDLYCGTGTIGLTMANNVSKVIGVEIIEESIKDANINAKINGIDNAQFICSDADKAAKMLKSKNINPSVVIIDPPRKGCGVQLINTVVEMAPRRIVYVSCDPDTLARDLKMFEERGYSTKEATPVDMFPRTAHVETVCLIIRN